jgi:hypothetical protein
MPAKLSALTLPAVLFTVLAENELAAVVDQEAGHADELVPLLRNHLNGQLIVNQDGAGELEAISRRGVLQIDG